MRFALTRMLASLVGLACLAAPAVAEACSCIGAHVEAWPTDNAVDVPRNARIWIGALRRPDLFVEEEQEPAELFELVGPDGELAITVTELDNRTYGGGTPLDGLWIVHPSELMVPGPHRVLAGADRALVLEFTVGDEVDEEAPAIPEVVDQTYSVASASGCFEESRSVTLGLAEPADLVVIEQEGGDVLDTAAIAGGVADAAPTSPSENSLSFGRGPCLYNWLDAEPGAETRIRLGAYDVAGNFSGWGPWIEVQIPSGCQCSATTDDPRGPLGLLFVAALLLGRRRARRVRPGCPQTPEAS